MAPYRTRLKTVPRMEVRKAPFALQNHDNTDVAKLTDFATGTVHCGSRCSVHPGTFFLLQKRSIWHMRHNGTGKVVNPGLVTKFLLNMDQNSIRFVMSSTYFEYIRILLHDPALLVRILN